MKSITKNKPQSDIIARMVEKFFAPLQMKSCRELTEGFFNAAYEICLQNNDKVVLKIAPAKETRVMTYEKNIMFNEVEAMKLAARYGGIPVPAVIGCDAGCTICSSPYFFMKKIEGQSLNAVKNTLTPGQIRNIYIETGKINKKINEVRLSAFGYPGQSDFQGNAWYPVFRRMLEAGVNDALRADVDLKIPIDRLWLYLERDRSVFEEVTEPRLVHWDCWDGNIFVESGKVTGIIDWERSLWGDPLMEVGFRTYSDNTHFQKGYGITALTESQKRRALWYDIYLLLLMSLEYEYRHYETPDIYVWSTRLLEEQFQKL